MAEIPQRKSEYPPLGKPFIAEYRYGNRDFPIIHIKKDPRVDNYKAPEVGDPCPDKRFSDHTFIQVLPTNSDERVVWVYEKLDGPVITGRILDNDGNFATLSRQPVEAGAEIDSGYGVVSSAITPENQAFGVKQTVRVDEFAPITGFQIDPRYGVTLEYTKQLVDAATAVGGVEGLESVEIEPKNQFHSWRLSTKLSQLPADQVWYGYRKESFPDVLVNLQVVGTESYQPIPTWRTAPDMPLKARYVRKFSLGPPADDSPTISPKYWAEPYYYAVEYERVSENVSESRSTSTNSGTSTSSSIGTQSSTQSSTSEGTNSSASSGTSDSTSIGTSSSTNSGTSSSTSLNTSSSTNSGTQSSTSSGTSSSSASGSSSSSNSGTSSSSNNGTSTSTGTGSSSSNNVTNGVGGSSATVSNSGAALVGDRTTNTASSYTQTTFSTSTQTSSSSGSNSSSNSGTQSSTSSGTNSSENSGSSGSSNSGSSSSENSGTSSGTNSGSSSSENSGSSSSTSSGTQSSTSSGTSNSTTSGTNSSTSESTNVGTSESENQSVSESATTSRGKSIFNLALPKCLRSDISVILPSGEQFVINATRQTDLDWGQYVEVARQSEHWKQGIWITEIIEVYLPPI